jgi:hypothetical protein
MILLGHGCDLYEIRTVSPAIRRTGERRWIQNHYVSAVDLEIERRFISGYVYIFR